MAKRRKNLGRVKRYRHSFHSGKQIAKSTLLWVLIILVMLGAGYLFAPRILDFGTRTWYSLTDRLGGFGASSTSTPEPTATLAPTPMPTATAAPVQELGIIEGDWADVSLSALASQAQMDETVAALAAKGVHYVVVPLKDTSGYLHYASGLEEASGSIAANVLDAVAVADAITAAGMVPVASIAAFQDPLAGYQNIDLAIRYQDSEYRWLDNTADAGGKSWLNPYAEQAVNYIGDIIGEVSAMGFQHVVLSQVQFPNQISVRQNFGNVGSATRADALRAAVANWDARFAAQDVILWYEYDYTTCLTPLQITEELPSALGLGHVIIDLPLATTENPTPDVSALADVIADLKASGSEYIVVYENGSATFS